jgi:geranylgeranyl diphosphate synthase, type II
MIEEYEIITESDNLWEYVEGVKPLIEKALRENLPLAPSHIETQFNEAIEYALFPGGKLLRPVLTLLGAEIVGGKVENVLSSSAAVEFVHTSSLIFDDLPCMDNASERRGKKSLHEKYGEGLAVLVGIALLNASYGLVFESTNIAAERQIAAHKELIDCIGASGLVGGQSVDLAVAYSSKSSFSATEFESIRNLKTSSLMRLALRVGAILSGADYMQLNALSRFAELLGDAYQTSDDLIDLEEDSEQEQGTFAQKQGISDARFRVSNLISDAKEVLRNEFGNSSASNLLCAMADYIAERKS